MSEDTITPETTTANQEAPTNVIPLPAQESENTTAPEANTTGQNVDPVQQIIANTDLTKLTKDDIFVDIINQSKLFAFRLMVGAALLEQLIIRDQPAPASEEKPSE
jgi:hypothetical protein